MTNLMFYFSSCTRPRATKHSMVVAYHEGLPPINSQETLNMWSYEVIWQVKSILAPFITMLWLLDLLGW